MVASTPTLSIVVFVVLIVVLAALRIYSDGRVTIEVKEILAAISVVGIGLFVFGEITEIAFGDVKLVRRLKEAQSEIVQIRISDTSNTVVFERQHTDEKGGRELIPELVESKTTALSFTLGSQYYVPAIVAEYLLRLTEAPYLRYVVFKDEEGSFVGIADAMAIAAAFRVSSGVLTPEQLTAWIKRGSLEKLETLPGFVDAESAVKDSDTTRQALDAMVKRHAASLPVIDGSGAFKGIVYQDQLVLAILDALTGVSPSG